MAESPRIEELKRRVQVDPASIAFAALAEEYRRAGRFEEAIATCQSGLQRHPAYLSAHVTLGRALLELNRFDEARQELEHVLRAAPENLAAIRGLAEIHHRRGELPEALEQYRSALQVAKHDTEIERAVDQISKQVTPRPDTPPKVEQTQTPHQQVAAPVPEPPRKPIQLVTRPAPAPVPEPEPPVAEPEPPVVELEPPVVEPEALVVEPETPVIEPELALITEPEPPIVATQPIAPLAVEAPTFHDEPEVKPDPTVLALERLLAAILREKETRAAGDGRR
jgi:tetratricopeptide (TPR) repeat protein